MKYFAWFALGLALLTTPTRAAQVKISQLPLKTTVSTNTFIEVADMNAVTKSGKYLITNLAPNTLVGITNALGLTGSTTTFLNSAGGQTTPAGSGGTPGTLITNGASIATGDLVAYGSALTNTAKATSANVQTALGQVYQGTNGNLTIYAGIATNTLLGAIGGAALASPALTGTPTINGQSIETQLTNRVLKAGDTMSGTLAVTGFTNTARTASTFVVAAADKSDSSTATSAVLGATLSDETGLNTTGKAVFNDSPTLSPSANTSGLTISGYSMTTSNTSAALDISGTWNNGTGTNTALKVNITDTASSAGSLLADFQIGGSTKASVNKAGYVNAIGTTGVQPGFYALLNTDTAARAALGLDSANAGQLAFGAGGSNSRDTFLLRDAANTLAMRNGTTAQAFRIYNTYTDASNNENAYLGWSANILTVSPIKSGTGQNRELQLGGIAASQISFYTAGASKRWQIDGSGHFVAGTDNTYDIGASGATRPRNVFAGGAFVSGASGFFQVAGKSFIDSNTDSWLCLKNNAGNDFSRLQFGGISSSFPAIKRSTTNLVIRLADDSADTGLQAFVHVLSKTVTAAGTTGDQTINKASGSVNFAAAAQTITVTDSLVDANSIITATVATDDTTAKSVIAVPGAGSFVLKLNAAATAETRVSFRITN